MGLTTIPQSKMYQEGVLQHLFSTVILKENISRKRVKMEREGNTQLSLEEMESVDGVHSDWHDREDVGQQRRCWTTDAMNM